MSDITPADALRELGDDQAEYAAAAAKKLGLPESKPMLQAIRDRWERDPSNTYPSDVGTLLAEVERLQMKGIEDCRVLHGYLNDRDIEIARLKAEVATAHRHGAGVGRRSTLDPGAFVKRGRDDEGDYERMDKWQERALLAGLAALDAEESP